MEGVVQVSFLWCMNDYDDQIYESDVLHYAWSECLVHCVLLDLFHCFNDSCSILCPCSLNLSNM
jgi:hypothetical protein